MSNEYPCNTCVRHVWEEEQESYCCNLDNAHVHYAKSCLVYRDRCPYYTEVGEDNEGDAHKTNFETIRDMSVGDMAVLLYIVGTGVCKYDSIQKTLDWLKKEG